MKKKYVVGTLAILCILGIWKYTSHPIVVPDSTEPKHDEQQYKDMETRLEKLDKDVAKQTKETPTVNKQIEEAKKKAYEKEGVFKKIGKGSDKESYYVVEVIEKNKPHYYIINKELDVSHFIFKNGDQIRFNKAYVEALKGDMIFSISSK